MVLFVSIANKGSDTGQPSQYSLHRNTHFISSSVLRISQQPLSLQGTVQLVIVLEFSSSTHPNTLLYVYSNPSCRSCASCFVSNLRRSFKNVNASVPFRTSGFSLLEQIVKFESGGGLISALLLLLFVTTSPPASAAAAMTLIDTVTVAAVLDEFIPNGPTGATAAAPPALTPDAQDAATF